MDEASAHKGTQSIERAILVLRELAARGTMGWRLLDLAAQCRLDRATTHRILQALVRERLAEQHGSDRRYAVGPLLFELGVSNTPLTRFQDACRTAVGSIARHLRAVATVSLRSDSDFVCIARAGPALRAMTVVVGTRRPLITSVSGVAILIALPGPAMRNIVADNLQRLERYDDQRRRSLRAMLRRSEACGYAISEGRVVPGISAIGVPILDEAHEPVASLALVAHSADFPSTRIDALVGELQRQARGLEQAVRALHEARAQHPAADAAA